MAVMFGVLLYYGGQIYQSKPPIPAVVTSVSGETLFSRAEIERGQNLWQSMGGMQQGSIWGHGSYVAPDWSADWLHREAMALLDLHAQGESGAAYGALAEPDQARLRAILRRECAPTPMRRPPARSPSAMRAPRRLAPCVCIAAISSAPQRGGAGN